MARRAADDDDDDLDFRRAMPVAKPDQWENPTTAKEVQSILNGMEIEEIDATSRMTLQRWWWRSYALGKVNPALTKQVQGNTILALRCIVESEGNADALCDPILRAVSMAISRWEDRGMELVEAFDQIGLTQLRAALIDLDILDDREVSTLFERAIGRRLAQILHKPEPVKAAKPSKRELREQAAAKRAAANERAMNLAKRLLAFREVAPDNKTFSPLRARQFPDIDAQHASQLMLVARVYGDRPDLWKASWSTLYALASPSLPDAKRHAFERVLAAGGHVGANDIRAACARRQRRRRAAS
jgi:hypothetical protein